MQWLSKRAERLIPSIAAGTAKKYDVIVIGSGYGGAVAASRYARAGLSVCVLERGREYVAGEFPNDIATLPRHVRLERADRPEATGREDALFDVRVSRDVTVLVGSALGGTSQINANVALRPDPEVLRSDPWPTVLRRPGESLDPYYTLAEKMLGANPIPGDLPKREALFALGEHVRQGVAGKVRDVASRPDTQNVCVPITVTLQDGPNAFGVRQNACVRCGDCVTGCNYGAKNTLTMNYLADACAHGAELWTGASVTAIRPRRAGGAWVYFALTGAVQPWPRGEAAPAGLAKFSANVVVLAAGSLGSTEILLRSRELKLLELSPALGTRFSGNGDALAFGFEHERRVRGAGWGWRRKGIEQTGADGEPLAEVGPTITGMIDARRGVPRERGVVIQDGAIPGPLTKFFQELITTSAAVEQLDRFAPLAPGCDPAAPRSRTLSHSQTLLAMGHDDAQGRLRLKDDKLVIDWPSGPYQPLTQWQSELMALGRKLGGVYLYNPLHRPLPDRVASILSGPGLRGTPIIVHPLGGCAMADRCDQGVVNDRGALYDCKTPSSTYRGLYVWDGSIMAGPLGVNPLLTITALAERNVELDLESHPAPRAHGGAMPMDRDQPTPALPSKFADPPKIKPYRPPAVPDTQTTTLDWQETLRGKLLWLGLGRRQAELCLTIRFRDIDAFLAQPDRRLEISPASARGRPQWLRLDCPGAASPGPCTLDVQAGGSFSLLHVAPRNLLLRLLLLPLRAFLTGLSVAWKRRFEIIRWLMGRGPAIPWSSVLPLLWRAYEVREMQYRVNLRGKSASYTLHGVKRFAQRCTNNVWQSLVVLRVVVWRSVAFGKLRLPLWPVGWGNLSLDGLDLVDDRKPEIERPVDLVNALQSLARLPLFIARALFPIYWWDFGLPDYPSRARPVPRLPGAQRVVQRIDTNGPGKGYREVAGAAPIGPERFWFGVPEALDSNNRPKNEKTLQLVLSRFQSAETRARDPATTEQVLLLHGFGQSALGFGVQTVDANLIEVLCCEGFDVWLLDYRTSLALASAYAQHDLDQVASVDVPAAVDYVLRHCGSKQLSVLGHCMGGAVLAMALLEGRLKDKVKKAVISQVPPFIIGGASAQARRQVAAFVRDVLNWPGVDLAADDGTGSWWTAIDRLLASFPTRSLHEDRLHDERCPGEHQWLCPRTDTATCKRVTAIVGRIFRHANINPETHKVLDQLFGWCNITVFNQIAKFFEYERIVNRDGVNCYLTEGAIRKHLQFPIAFVHGTENELFDWRSTRRTVGELEMINGPGNYKEIYIDDHGHYDCMIGKNAHRVVFGDVADFLLNFTGVGVDKVQPPIELRLPRLGPLLGWMRETREGTAVTVWAKADPATTPTPVYAITAVYDASRTLLNAQRWPLLVGKPNACVAGNMPSCINEDGQPIALADVVLPPAGAPFTIAMLFAYPTMHGHADGEDELPDLPRGDCTRDAASMNEIDARMTEFGNQPLDKTEVAKAIVIARSLYRRQLDQQDATVEKILSRAKRERKPFENCEARVSAELLAAHGDKAGLRFFAGTCRYPGTLVDSVRSDAAFGAIERQLAARDDGPSPQFLLLCGDQIYADRNAAVLNITSRLEKFSVRYRDAWGSPNFRRLARVLPLRMAMDDHEIEDGWSNSSATNNLVPELAAWGKAAFLAYQRSHGPRDPAPAWSAFDYPFDASGFAFYVLDTRSERWTDPPHPREIMSPQQMARLECWLSRQNPEAWKFIVSGSVFVPGLRDDDYGEWGDPHAEAYPERADGWQGFPESRAALIRLVARCRMNRVVFIAGDYHCSAAMRLCIDDNGRKYDAYSIVVRAFYAPFHLVNETPRTVIDSGRIDCGGGLELRYAGQVFEGCGYSEITVGASGLGLREFDAAGAIAVDCDLTRLPRP